jgi:hypothetical protein
MAADGTDGEFTVTAATSSTPGRVWLKQWTIQDHAEFHEIVTYRPPDRHKSALAYPEMKRTEEKRSDVARQDGSISFVVTDPREAVEETTQLSRSRRKSCAGVKKERFAPAVSRQERTTRLILAAVRYWELTRKLPD